MEILIRRGTLDDKPDWLRMRLLLWIYSTAPEFEPELDTILEDPGQAVFIASTLEGRRVGFVEASTRTYAEGCETSPVGYVEGWYVDEDLRGLGIGTRLVETAEEWARSKGYEEMGSDTWLDNEASIYAHLKMGYEEVERLVHFVKRL
ncbi:MAG: aminoglycoside 6'-N-acetyltransferase [Bacteroidota bacterium]